jgi:hypothetical protein
MSDNHSQLPGRHWSFYSLRPSGIVPPGTVPVPRCHDFSEVPDDFHDNHVGRHKNLPVADEDLLEEFIESIHRREVPMLDECL